MPYYKAVSESLGSSTMRPKRNTGLHIQYKLDEFVSADPELLAKGWGLFVFDDKEVAMRHVGMFSNRVFECEVEGLMPQRQLIGDILSVTAEELLNSPKDMYFETPEHTILVKSVKLTKEMAKCRIPAIRLLE